jgi:flagellar basal body P-ring formation protein FlgA
MVRTPALLRHGLHRLVRLLPAMATTLVASLASPHALATPAEPPVLSDTLLRAVEGWTRERAEAGDAGAGAGGRVRLEVELGQLDPRLRLAPCARIEPYLPGSSRPWGRTRVGLRCVDGPTRWNVYLPVQVRVLATAPVLREPLPAGTEITLDHLTEAEVDWAATRQPPLIDPEQMIGRKLTRGLSAGDALRAQDLQRPVWFDAGDTVKVVALGPGYEVSAQGQALSRGVDGQSVRVRTGNGRVITGTAVAERRVELPL